MNIVPGKDAQEWAAFNNNFGKLLSAAPFCFLIVVGGSVYGIHQSINSQYPGASLLLAICVAFLIQMLNSVSVHFSTRMIASWFLKDLSGNKNQRVSKVDTVVGWSCILFTLGICFFDFEANKRGAEEAAKRITEAPVTERVDTSAHTMAVQMASLAVQSAKSAEDAERRAFEADVDRQINGRKAALNKRHSSLTKVSAQWAKNEMRSIESELRSLETTRRNRKAEFVPKKSDVAGAQTQLAAISAENSRRLLDKQVQVDSTNTRKQGDYESKKDSAGTSIFVVYIIAMILWHFCHAMKNYRALRFDEQHPESGNPLIAIVETLKDGAGNWLWTIRAKLAEKLPEEEIRGYVKEDMLAALNSRICQDTFSVLVSNPGIKEAGIYMSLPQYDPMDVRQALRWLKTSKLAFENSGTWTGDAAQAEKIPGFFLSNP